MKATTAPARFDDPLNAAILAISEDQLAGFQRDPLGEIARRADIDLDTVIERIRAMLAAGTIRRVRQTLLSTNLAEGALVAWQVPQRRLQQAFDYMFQEDPFSGHVVIRTTDSASAGSSYRLWTTLKVPQSFSLEKHARYLAEQVGAERFRLMPAKRLFVLGVGHVRRRNLQPGSKADQPAQAIEMTTTRLDELEWRVLTALKREFSPDEIVRDIWQPRAEEAGVPLDVFYQVAESLQRRGLMGRFSTFLEHVKPVAGGQ
ncbi:MAG TPA: Lrp/AsnC family transcriptional regulator, partial [Dehalococcoidia bacterium]|nr:Lrp/AsnC family transcriptional regulator [Dehalococcoidia bacterium]